MRSTKTGSVRNHPRRASSVISRAVAIIRPACWRSRFIVGRPRTGCPGQHTIAGGPQRSRPLPGGATKTTRPRGVGGSIPAPSPRVGLRRCPIRPPGGGRIRTLERCGLRSEQRSPGSAAGEEGAPPRFRDPFRAPRAGSGGRYRPSIGNGDSSWAAALGGYAKSRCNDSNGITVLSVRTSTI